MVWGVAKPAILIGDIKKGRPTRILFGTSEAQGVTNPDPFPLFRKKE